MKTASNTWYREPWPWPLMSGPAAVIVAGAFTMILAYRSNDGVVADDYYRSGLEVNRVLERDREARTAGLTASLTMEEGAVRIAVNGNEALPRVLRLTVLHPTRGGADRVTDVV